LVLSLGGCADASLAAKVSLLGGLRTFAGRC